MRQRQSGKRIGAARTKRSPAPSVPNDAQPLAGRRRNYARWRALSLSLVYVLFAVHIAHWKLTGKTLAPLELNEVMYTLELGIITAGFLFMCLLVLGTLIFGRFFCSWACHIMVLQDLCAWLLRRIGIRAKPIRSRLLLWIPPLTACYMFLWPQVVRAWEARSFPTFHWATDADGWASLATTNFWRNLPGPWIIALTFLICGFVIVYLLGSRTFCTYVCPYGAVFALADRLSPGRILVNDRCRQCGRCTAACTSGVRVHDEVRLHGMVVNPACLKDLDCVSVCPENALRYGFSRPALFKSRRSGGRFGLPYSFSLAEELLMASVFFVVLLSMRGLYARIPFLLSLAMGVIAGYLFVLSLRLARRADVSLGRWKLRTVGRMTPPGWVYAGAMVMLSALIVHSAFIRYHEYFGLRHALALKHTTDPDARRTIAGVAFDHFRIAERWGLFRNERIEREAIDVAAALDREELLDRYIARYLTRHPYDAAVNLLKARSLVARGRTDEAIRQFRWITAQHADNEAARRAIAAAHAALGSLYAKRGAFEAAAEAFGRALSYDDRQAGVHAELGAALAELGRVEEAIGHLRFAVQLDPTLERAHYNLGVLLAHAGRWSEALLYYERAETALPDDADVQNNLGAALLRMGRRDEARQHLERALTLNPSHADAHFNLGVLLASGGDEVGASRHFHEAVRLDARYAEFLETR